MQAIKRVVNNMCQSTPGLEAALVLDGEGSSLATILPDELLKDTAVNEGLVCAMVMKALIGTSWVAEKLGKGNIDVMIAKTSKGSIFIREVESTNPAFKTPLRIVVVTDSLIPIELALLHIEKVIHQIINVI